MIDIFNHKRIKELEAENKELQTRNKDLEEKLTLKNELVTISGSLDNMVNLNITGTTLLPSLDSHNVARYVSDYYGGEVILQEATDLTVLDESGKATYHKTKQQPDKGFKYKLERAAF